MTRMPTQCCRETDRQAGRQGRQRQREGEGRRERGAQRETDKHANR